MEAICSAITEMFMVYYRLSISTSSSARLPLAINIWKRVVANSDRVNYNARTHKTPHFLEDSDAFAMKNLNNVVELFLA